MKKKQRDYRVNLNPEHHAWLVEQATARGTNTSVLVDMIFRFLDFDSNKELEAYLNSYIPKLTEYGNHIHKLSYYQTKILKKLKRGDYDKIMKEHPEIFKPFTPDT